MWQSRLIAWLAPIAALVFVFAPRAEAQEMPPEHDMPPEHEMPPEQDMPPEEAPPMDPEMPEIEDPHPLVVMHAINQIQSQLGLMGINEASDDDVRSFAEELTEQHDELDRELLGTANDLDIEVAGTGAVRIAMEMQLQEYEPQLQTLMQAPGEEFDDAFLDMVNQSQADAIEAVEALRDEVEEDEVEALLEQSLERYQAHQQRAQELAE